MGLFDFLKGKDEEAMPEPGSAEFQQAVEGSKLPGSEITTSGKLEWTSTGEAKSAEELGRQVAGQLGLDPDNVEVQQSSSSQTIDLRGTGARDQVEEALRAAGIDPNKPGQQIDASQIPGLTETLKSILTQHGAQIPDAGGVSGWVGGSGEAADPIAQVEHLAKLRDEGHLTEAQFQAQKKHLLGE